jgi:hypothetical protein
MVDEHEHRAAALIACPRLRGVGRPERVRDLNRDRALVQPLRALAHLGVGSQQPALAREAQQPLAGWRGSLAGGAAAPTLLPCLSLRRTAAAQGRGGSPPAVFVFGRRADRAGTTATSDRLVRGAPAAALPVRRRPGYACLSDRPSSTVPAAQRSIRAPRQLRCHSSPTAAVRRPCATSRRRSLAGAEAATSTPLGQPEGTPPVNRRSARAGYRVSRSQQIQRLAPQQPESLLLLGISGQNRKRTCARAKAALPTLIDLQILFFVLPPTPMRPGHTSDRAPDCRRRRLSDGSSRSLTVRGFQSRGSSRARCQCNTSKPRRYRNRRKIRPCIPRSTSVSCRHPHAPMCARCRASTRRTKGLDRMDHHSMGDSYRGYSREPTTRKQTPLRRG